MRDTVCANLNDRDPDQANIMARLAKAESRSAVIVAALKLYYSSIQLAGITVQELNALNARMAYLEQENEYLKKNQRGASDEPTPEQGDQPALEMGGPSNGSPLPEQFLINVAKAARPALRLDDIESEKAVKAETARVAYLIETGVIKPNETG